MDAVTPLLVNGDFYQVEDKSNYQHDPGSDLAIKAFAWPCILQAAGLTSLTAGKLGLSRTGRKALSQPAQDVIRNAWDKWVDTKLFDEFERIDVIKGKQSARLSAVADRRNAVNDVLADCPVGRWIAVDEFFRFLCASGENFTMARVEWKLYISMQQYGHFGYEQTHSWDLLQGRYILATLFEYAATLGLIDVAYIPPQLARNDLREHWGTDDYLCLSRYDGLKFFRLNALGAWCLGLTQDYEPEPVVTKKTWRVLPNHDVVSSEQNPDPGDVLFLDRVAERTSQGVWRLDREKILTAAEAGLGIEEISGFLESQSAEPIPDTVSTLLDDLRQRGSSARQGDCPNDRMRRRRDRPVACRGLQAQVALPAGGRPQPGLPRVRSTRRANPPAQAGVCRADGRMREVVERTGRPSVGSWAGSGDPSPAIRALHDWVAHTSPPSAVTVCPTLSPLGRWRPLHDRFTV